MDDTFKSFMWFGAALALVIVGTMAMLGTLSIDELMSGRHGKLSEQISTLKQLVRESENSSQRKTNSLQLLKKQNLDNEKRLENHLDELAVLDQYAIHEKDLSDALKARDALFDDYEQKRKAIIEKIRGTVVEKFTTADGRSFKSVTIKGDNGSRVSLRSEFGGRSLTYDELSGEMKDLFGISPVIEKLRAELTPNTDEKPKVVIKRFPAETRQESEEVIDLRNQLVAARERSQRLSRMALQMENEASRLEMMEMQKTIKSADARNKIIELRNAAVTSRAEMLRVTEEINKLSGQLHSEY